VLSRIEQDRLARRARLLYSWCEKARLLATGRRVAREQDLPQPMDAVRTAAYLDEQHRKAQRKLDEFLAKLRERMEDAQDLARVAAHQQRLLAAKAAEGQIDAKTANEENHRLQAEIRERGSEANLCNAVLALDSAESHGGFIDLPLTRYARELERFKVSDSSSSDSRDPAEKKPERDAPVPPVPAWVKQMQALIPLQLGRWDVIAIGVALATVFVAALYFLYSTQFSGSVSFDMLPAPQGTWVLSVENKTPRKITMAVPGNVGQSTAKADYAVYVEMKESGQADFRRLPDTERAWVYGGTANAGDGPTEVGPGLNAKWTLSPAHLTLPSPDALLRVVVMSGNRTVHAQELIFETKS